MSFGSWRVVYNGSMGEHELDARGLIVACPSCNQKNRLAYDRLNDRVRCARCKTSIAAPASPIDVHDSAVFDRLVDSVSVPVIVDYWAPWCGPCRMVAPELQKVAARQAGKALVVKVNTDELSDLGQRFGIRSIPTMAVFSGGKEVARTSGARPAADIEAFLEQSVAAPR
jgi:thioredoxin 2